MNLPMEQQKNAPDYRRIKLSSNSSPSGIRFKKKGVWCTRGGCGSFGKDFKKNAPGNICKGHCGNHSITMDELDDYEIMYLIGFPTGGKSPVDLEYVNIEKITNL